LGNRLSLRERCLALVKPTLGPNLPQAHDETEQILGRTSDDESLRPIVE